MAKKDAQNNKKVVDKPVAESQGTPKLEESTVDTQATPVEGKAATENVQPELPVQPEQNNGEQPNDKANSQLDSESKAETTGEKGSEANNPVTDENPEDVYDHAKVVISEMVNDAIDESGILDEPKETTEKRNRIAADVFQKNTNCKVLYFTTDLIPFFVKSDAVRHGATLKNDTVVTINRK